MEMAATFERSEPGIHRGVPPRGLLTEAMGDWLASIADRLDRPVADLLQHRARSLAGVYLAEWGEPVVPLDGPREDRFVDRVAGALAFHWWRFGRLRFRPLDEVVHLVQSGRFAHGRVQGDVLREVVLAEAFCQGHPVAAARFLAEYVPVIAAAARSVGGRRAVEEFQGFEAELILPRDGRPAKLALYSGHTPLRLWLRQVVRNEWMTRARRRTLQPFEGEFERVQQAPPSGERIEEHECLDILQPMFEEAVAALTGDQAVVLRMTLLDDVPQKDIARLWNVHKSTISRLQQCACRTLADRFDQLAIARVQQTDAADCLRWLLNASWEGRQFLGESLFRSLQRVEASEPVESRAGSVLKSRASSLARRRGKYRD